MRRARDPRRRLLVRRHARAGVPASRRAYVPRRDGVGGQPARRRRVRARRLAGRRRAPRRCDPARAVILATGAQERPFPIPGWTLPGVVTAGAAQMLLKIGGRGSRGDGRCSPAAGRCCGCSRRSTCARAWPSTRCSTRRRAAATPRRCPHAWGFVALAIFRQGPEAAARGARHTQHRRARDRARGGRRRRGSTASATKSTAQPPAPGRPAAAASGRGAQHQPVNAIGCEHRVERAQPASIRSSTRGAARRSPACPSPATARASPARTAAEARGQLAALAVARAGKDRRQDARQRGATRHGRRLPARRAAARSSTRSIGRPTRSGCRAAIRSSAVARKSPRARSATRARGLQRTQPDEGVSALRDGAVPGALLRIHGHRADRAARGVSPREVGYYRLRFPVKPITLGRARRATLPRRSAARRVASRVRPDARRRH